MVIKRAIAPAKKTQKALPLRLVLVVPFVVQIVGAVGLVGYLSFHNGQQAVNNLASQLMDRASDRVNDRLDNYLAIPHQLNQINVDAIELGRFDLQDFEGAGQYFWSQMQVYNVSYIYYALTTGEYAAAGRWMEGQGVTIDELSPNTNWKSDTYATDSQGNRTKIVGIYDDYKPLEEIWYKEALKAGKPIWTKPFNWDEIPIERLIPFTTKIANQSAYLVFPCYSPISMTFFGKSKLAIAEEFLL